MELTFRQKGSTLNISVIGAIDNAVAGDFRAQLKSLLEKKFSETVFNFKHVPFVTSQVVGALLSYYKMAVKDGKKMRVKGISDDLLELFQSLQLNKVFPIEK